MGRTRDRRITKGAVHPSVKELCRQVEAGRIDRREFLRTATLLGLSASAAYAVSGLPGPVSEAEAAPKSGGVMRMAMVVQDISDPHKYDWGEKANIGRQICEYLTVTGADNVTRPMLAESWQVSDDLKTWTFALRKGVTFGNGDALTADDVVYNVKRWLDPATGSSMLGLLNGMVDTTDGKDKDGKPIKIKKMTPGAVEKLDAHTVRFHLNAPDLALPEKLYHYPAMIVHRSFDEKGGNLTKAPELGTGPYTLAEYKVGEKAVLKRRKTTYWDDAPHLSEIHYIDLGTEATAALAALASGQVDGIYQINLNTLEAARAIPGVKILEATTAQTGVIRMQVDAKPFDDIRVRKAILLASDNVQNLKTSHRGLGSPGENHHVCDCQPDYAALPPVKRDVAAAKKLLAEAGHAKGLSVTCNVGNTQGTWEQDSVVVLKQNLADAGITLKVNVMPAAQYWEVWDKAPFSLTSWAHRPLGTMSLGLAYRSGVPWNETHYASKEFDALLGQAESTIDIEARRKVMGKVEKRLQDDAIMVQPFFRSVMTACSTKVKGIEMHPSNYHNWNKVWIDA
ncbi:MAG: ABC transporter substrate-binding protein [Rhodospirillaceae bacterium]|nr:ABC transporter substrate-binding protein [Rhodospirillaceae bacterium]MDD9929907.1 ABC transporter substrate-binding protein [Rhodospirillaceae bacterium]